MGKMVAETTAIMAPMKMYRCRGGPREQDDVKGE